MGSVELVADEVNLIRPERFAGPGTRVVAMTRYRADARAGRGHRFDGDTVAATLRAPQRAIAPGQLVALFDETGDEVLGAATIREATG